MKKLNTYTRLRLTQEPGQSIWNSHLLLSTNGYKWVRITRPTGYDNFVAEIFTEDNQSLDTFECNGFVEIKEVIKERLVAQGCVFLDEVRTRTTVV